MTDQLRHLAPPPPPAADEFYRTSEAQLRSVLETALDIILKVGRDGTILYINRVLPPLSIAQVVGACCYEFVLPESRHIVEDAVRRVFETRQPVEYEIQGPPGPSGKRIWSHVRVGPLIEGEQVTAAIMCATDISSRKAAEEDLRLSKLQLQKIASQVPGVVYQFLLRPDGSSCFPYASEGIRQIYRVAPEDVRDDASCVFAMLHPDDHDSIVKSIQASAATLQPWQREYRVRFPDGAVRWLYGSSLPEKQSDGSILWHGFITDITERRKVEAAAAELEAQLRQTQKVESIGRLAGGVAHDFNNLLTSILGFAEMARRDLPPDSLAADSLGRVAESARRGGALVQQLLAFARKKIIQPEVLDLNQVVAEMEPLLRRLIGENIELTFLPFAQLPPVRVDCGSIEQVIMNLVVNARDAMPSGGRLSIETRAVVLDGDTAGPPLPGGGAYVLLAVSDTGIGMSPQTRARIFEPFFTTKPVGEGTGLGLAVCHGIVSQALGHIDIQTELGKGSAFYVYLPAAGVAVHPLPPPAPVPLTAAGTETILLVEDDELIRSCTAKLMAMYGYNMLTACNGVDALEKIRTAAVLPDLLLTDVIMPKMNGAELATQLKKIYPRIKVLYTSGYTEDAIVRQGALSAGINFIQKPYNPADLAARVRAIFDTAPSE